MSNQVGGRLMDREPALTFCSSSLVQPRRRKYLEHGYCPYPSSSCFVQPGRRKGLCYSSRKGKWDRSNPYQCSLCSSGKKRLLIVTSNVSELIVISNAGVPRGGGGWLPERPHRPAVQKLPAPSWAVPGFLNIAKTLVNAKPSEYCQDFDECQASWILPRLWWMPSLLNIAKILINAKPPEYCQDFGQFQASWILPRLCWMPSLLNIAFDQCQAFRILPSFWSIPSLLNIAKTGVNAKPSEHCQDFDHCQAFWILPRFCLLFPSPVKNLWSSQLKSLPQYF